MPDIFISDSLKKKEEKPVKKISSKKKTPSPIERESSKDEEVVVSKKIHKNSPLAAYCYLPEGFSFENKEEDEKIILFLRKHPITNVGWISLTVVMIFAPLLLPNFPILEFLPLRFQFIAILGWYLVTLALALESFLTWFFNVSIVTDKRIVDIDFVNLIYKQISDTTIDRVQDVTYKMGGVVRTIFDYGDVQVETAGELPNFDFQAVPKPDQVAKVIEGLVIKDDEEEERIRA